MAESKDRFFIPNKIKVGYQERTDTFTGKLSYIIYYDETGKLRKKASWDSWRNNSIPDDEFENTPTEGFYLNKAVGGYKYSWNYRMSYCRIYDPRGFEFEISIDNLLWLLNYSECVKGKKLTGKFVYSWVGTDLVLLPCDSEEYDESITASTKMIDTGTVKTSDLIPGALSKVKDLPYTIRSKRKDDEPKDSCVFLGNFKLSRNMGQGYETKPIFYDKNTDLAFTMSKTSIKFMSESNFLTAEEVKELTHRFEISAYSYNFWKSAGIVEKFLDVTDIKFAGLSGNDSNIFPENYQFRENHYSGIIKATGELYLLRPLLTCTGTTSYYGRGTSYRTGYKDNEMFIMSKLEVNSDNNIMISDWTDIGKPAGLYRYGYYRSSIAFTDLYPDSKVKTCPSCISTESQMGGNVKYIAVGYETTDGYISNSLHHILKHDRLFEMHKLEYFPLPIKL